MQAGRSEYRKALRSVGSGTADARIRLVGEGARIIIGGDDVHHLIELRHDHLCCPASN